MKEQNIHKTIKEFIRNGKTDAVFESLKKEKLSDATVQVLTILEAEYKALQDAELKGLYTTEELQVRKNKINNRLLALSIDGNSPSKNKPPRIKRTAAFIGSLISGGLLFWFFGFSNITCPSYPANINNKILIFPFENLGDKIAKPQISLYKRINELTTKNKLSAKAELVTDNKENLTTDQVLDIGKNCDIDLLVWGTYSSRVDSIRLVLEYYFTKSPEWNNLGELITLKDVTGLQKGKMLKSLDDAILSLCGILALREGDTALAKKWFEKVKDKEDMDQMLLKTLE